LEKAAYHTPQEVKAELGTASLLKGARVVFNIGGSKYRMILAIDYQRKLGFIRFVVRRRARPNAAIRSD